MKDRLSTLINLGFNLVKYEGFCLTLNINNYEVFVNIDPSIEVDDIRFYFHSKFGYKGGHFVVTNLENIHKIVNILKYITCNNI